MVACRNMTVIIYFVFKIKKVLDLQ